MISSDVIKTWGNTFRFLVIITLAFLCILFIIYKLSDNTQFNIDYTNDKTLITIIDKKNVIANSVLPACDCWSSTGIEIRPQEEYELKVSGKIHTTGDKLMKDAEKDIKPKFPWLGPEGDEFRLRTIQRFRNSDSLRKTMLLSQNARMGQVIFYFQKKNTPRPNCDLGLSFFNPDSILVYESEKGLSGKNDSEDTWFVWATVNDMIIKEFNKTNEIAYIGGSLNDTLTDKQKKWKKLKDENYNRIYFDDNIGNFVISVKILKPRHFFDW